MMRAICASPFSISSTGVYWKPESTMASPTDHSRCSLLKGRNPSATAFRISGVGIGPSGGGPAGAAEPPPPLAAGLAAPCWINQSMRASATPMRSPLSVSWGTAMARAPSKVSRSFSSAVRSLASAKLLARTAASSSPSCLSSVTGSTIVFCSSRRMTFSLRRSYKGGSLNFRSRAAVCQARPTWLVVALLTLGAGFSLSDSSLAFSAFAGDACICVTVWMARSSLSQISVFWKSRTSLRNSMRQSIRRSRNSFMPAF